MCPVGNAASIDLGEIKFHENLSAYPWPFSSHVSCLSAHEKGCLCYTKGRDSSQLWDRMVAFPSGEPTTVTQHMCVLPAVINHFRRSADSAQDRPCSRRHQWPQPLLAMHRCSISVSLATILALSLARTRPARALVQRSCLQRGQASLLSVCSLLDSS